MRQQVAEVTDTLVAALLILDNQRFSNRAKRACKSIREQVGHYSHRFFDSTLVKVLGGVSTVVFVITILNRFLHFKR
jgi:hypothetical protein